LTPAIAEVGVYRSPLLSEGLCPLPPFSFLVKTTPTCGRREVKNTLREHARGMTKEEHAREPRAPQVRVRILDTHARCRLA
jgi:hypothetical protein